MSGPTREQLRIAKALAIDISSESKSVAAARILEVVELAIYPEKCKREVSERMERFASLLEIEVRGVSFWVASALIGQELERRNQEAMERFKFQPGDFVRLSYVDFETGEIIEGKEALTISSLGRDGRIYFRKSQATWPDKRRCAWPHQLVKQQ